MGVCFFVPSPSLDIIITASQYQQPQNLTFIFIYILPHICYNIFRWVNPGVAELVPRHIWDVEIARSNRVTRTIIGHLF